MANIPSMPVVMEEVLKLLKSEGMCELPGIVHSLRQDSRFASVSGIELNDLVTTALNTLLADKMSGVFSETIVDNVAYIHRSYVSNGYEESDSAATVYEEDAASVVKITFEMLLPDIINFLKACGPQGAVGRQIREYIVSKYQLKIDKPKSLQWILINLGTVRGKGLVNIVSEDVHIPEERPHAVVQHYFWGDFRPDMPKGSSVKRTIKDARRVPLPVIPNFEDVEALAAAYEPPSYNTVAVVPSTNAVDASLEPSPEIKEVIAMLSKEPPIEVTSEEETPEPEVEALIEDSCPALLDILLEVFSGPKKVSTQGAIKAREVIITSPEGTSYRIEPQKLASLVAKLRLK